jgi:flagellar biosynthetic protein FliR
MDIHLNYLPQMFLLVMARVGAMMGGVVFFGRLRVPARLRLTVAFAITILLVPLVPPAWAKTSMSLVTLPDLVFAMIGEVLLGVALALICDVFLSVFVFAGYLMGFGCGLSMAQAIDPVGSDSDNIMGGFLQTVFFTVFILANGHLFLLRLLFDSFGSIPPQAGWLQDKTIRDILSLGGVLFVWGLKLAAPVVAAIFILDLSMGLISRMAPDFDVLFLSLPFKLLVGLIMLGLVLRYGGSVFSRLAELTVSGCGHLLAP